MTMQTFQLEATRTTPFVRLSPAEGLFEIRGKSHSEDSLSFFRRILEKLSAYSSTEKTLTAHMLLEYFNTSSAKCLFDVMKALDRLRLQGYDVHVKWYYEEEDYDMVEIGEDYADLTKVNFHFVELDEDSFQEELDKIEVTMARPAVTKSRLMQMPLRGKMLDGRLAG